MRLRLSLLAVLHTACSLPGIGRAGDDSAYTAAGEACEGLVALVAEASAVDHEFDLLRSNAVCADDAWRITTEASDEDDPPSRVDVATWDIATGAFGAETWALESDRSAWALELSAAVAGIGCAGAGPVVVLFPWWGDTLGEVDVVARGEAYQGAGLYAPGDTVAFHLDTPPGAADAGTMRVCEAFDHGATGTTVLAMAVEGEEERWSGEMERSAALDGKLFLAGGVVTAGGEVVGAAGFAEQ